ncbi:hypothetical protein, conserved [Leishmania donovani]|uniref:Uncharacterized protein n=1 Tax=Leishmania donovani TaxID=5661 RepID=E9BFF1_LEIDO|nr:hypothetical protein, conserved [Leishmania donovani]CBZ33977.1 hypothetical protein, conserved [Leishmania donovani]
MQPSCHRHFGSLPSPPPFSFAYAALAARCRQALHRAQTLTDVRAGSLLIPFRLPSPPPSLVAGALPDQELTAQ